MDAFRKIYPEEFYARFLRENVRPDGRHLKSVRRTRLRTGTVDSADGSALVNIGASCVCCGVKVEVGPAPLRAHASVATDGATTTTTTTTATPSAAAPSMRHNALFVNVELTSVCSTKFRQHALQPPSDEAQALASRLNELAASVRLVDGEALRGLQRPLDAAAADALAVVDDDGDAAAAAAAVPSSSYEEWAYYVFADCYAIDYDGNLFDACVTALYAALADTRVPVVVIDVDGRASQCAAPSRPLPLAAPLVPLTAALMHGFVLADPSAEEEQLCSTALSVVLGGDDGAIKSLYKPGGAAVDESVVATVLELAEQRRADVLALYAAAAAAAARGSTKRRDDDDDDDDDNDDDGDNHSHNHNNGGGGAPATAANTARASKAKKKT